MSRTGQEYIDGLRDGRRVFIEGEEVNDVTTHPAFRGAVGRSGRGPRSTTSPPTPRPDRSSRSLRRRPGSPCTSGT
jgi:4-hydroxyphenylacetate 3-monooxygenase